MVLILDRRQRSYYAVIGLLGAKILNKTAKIWIVRSAGPELIPVLTCCHICAALECALEGADCFEANRIRNDGNRVSANP